MRRSHKSLGGGEKEQQSLLLHQSASLLSDGTPWTHQASPAPKKNKKPSWRSRIFGNSKKSETNVPQDSAANARRAKQLQKQQRKEQKLQQKQQQKLQKQQKQQQKQQRISQSNKTKQSSRAQPTNINVTTTTTATNNTTTSTVTKQKSVLRSKKPVSNGNITSTKKKVAVQEPVMPKASVLKKRSMPPPNTTNEARNLPLAHQALEPSQKNVAKILQRPFGRLAVRPKDQVWVVQVAPAEWEQEETVWKYRVQLQRRIESDQEEILQELTQGNMTFRSLADFYWLEQALQIEYQGGLLLPSLSIYLGTPDLENCQHEVDSQLLTYWLSDVFNGIRGQGEWFLHNQQKGEFPVNWLVSESMEAFLYRAELPQPSEFFAHLPSVVHLPSRNPLASVFGNEKDEKDGNILTWVMNGEMCNLFQPEPRRPAAHIEEQFYVEHPQAAKINLPLNKQKVSSKALGDARSLNIQDSFADPTPDTNSTTKTFKHSNLLQAERELVWSWRTRALQAMEKLRVVQAEEKQIGASWKRFALALTNLFAYEKDVESAGLGPSKQRKDMQMPYRKLQKSSVEDVLRIMTKSKMERCTPALDLLGSMIGGYVADLSAVQTSVQVYNNALEDVSQKQEAVQILRDAESSQSVSTSLADHIQAGLHQVKKQLVTANNDGESDEARQARLARETEERQLNAMQQRLQANEALLHDFLTRQCQIVPLRTARMAFGYLQKEMEQAGTMHGAAANLKAKISVASKDSLSKMISRHHNETKEDRKTELALVQRMIQVHVAKKFPKTDDDETEEVAKGIEINKDTEDANGALRDYAFELCRERVGRWDSKVAMALMEAIGVTDANVRVEETTRELRLIRKYAIGLREHVDRCSEALDALQMSIVNGSLGDIRILRQDLMWEIQTLFSGTYQPIQTATKPLDIQALIEAGVPLSDPLGWRRKDDGCGGGVKAYLDLRDSGIEWLLKSLKGLLEEYNTRLESVESFVYMECVGIQLEKHFSQQRAEALAAFEKRTDITSAINIATRKRMPVLVKELQSKLNAIGTDVSHTTVKEAKEAHLESKTLKQELHDLAMRRLARARETSTERVIGLMALWANEEESVASAELQVLTDWGKTLEQSIGYDEVVAYLEAAPTIMY